MGKNKKPKPTPKAPRVYRDSTTGRFVTKKYAKNHPKTTEKSRRSVAAKVDETAL